MPSKDPFDERLVVGDEGLRPVAEAVKLATKPGRHRQPVVVRWRSIAASEHDLEAVPAGARLPDDRESRDEARLASLLLARNLAIAAVGVRPAIDAG